MIKINCIKIKIEKILIIVHWEVFVLLNVNTF